MHPTVSWGLLRREAQSVGSTTPGALWLFGAVPTDNRSHAVGRDHVDRNPQLLEHLEDTDVGSAAWKQYKPCIRIPFRRGC